MLVSNFIAHDSINLNARCAEGGREGNRKKKAMLIKDTWSKVIQRTGRFSDVRNVARESSSLIVCIPVVRVP